MKKMNRCDALSIISAQASPENVNKMRKLFAKESSAHQISLHRNHHCIEHPVSRFHPDHVVTE